MESYRNNSITIHASGSRSNVNGIIYKINGRKHIKALRKQARQKHDFMARPSIGNQS